MIHGILHVLGIDTQQSYWYDFWSGIGTQISLLLLGIGAYRRHNCHARWCPRLGKHPVAGTPFTTCRKHHPGMQPHTHSAEHIRSAWTRANR